MYNLEISKHLVHIKSVSIMNIELFSLINNEYFISLHHLYLILDVPHNEITFLPLTHLKTRF